MTTRNMAQPVATDDDEDVNLDFEAFEAELLCEVNRINGERLAA